MDTLQIQKKNAIEAYHKADSNGKKLLGDLLGHENFIKKEGKQIKTIIDACEALNIPIPEPFKSETEDAKAINAFRSLIIICRAINGDWKPDWNNSNQYKYYPCFDKNSGFGFSSANCGLWHADTGAGSRLCYKSSELALYAGEQFSELYRDLITL